ncbi:hypothetical protein [uncultured Serinicoccus sp.]|uniref:hypothetical protein n=1 Tax=uncultured Serinicoccus sp. TaxID=735514 RepID=UPI00262F70AD|nr:hypothetical protein [uncultured Serinicoccus sp.]
MPVAKAAVPDGVGAVCSLGPERVTTIRTTTATSTQKLTVARTISAHIHHVAVALIP